MNIICIFYYNNNIEWYHASCITKDKEKVKLMENDLFLIF